MQSVFLSIVYQIPHWLEIAFEWIAKLAIPVGAIVAVVKGWEVLKSPLKSLKKLFQKFVEMITGVRELKNEFTAYKEAQDAIHQTVEKDRVEFRNQVTVSFEQTTQLLSNIEKEFKSNGGSSLKDVVNKVQVDVSSLKAQQLSALDNDTDCGRFQTNAKGEFIFVNKLILRKLDRAERELMGKSWLSCIPASHRSNIEHEWNDCIKEGRDYECRFIFVTGDKDSITVNMKAFKLSDNSGYNGEIEFV